MKSVKARELPKADDDFAQMVSEFDTIDELMADLREQAAGSKTSQQALQARDRLVENLLERTEILLPASVVDAELSRRVAEDASAKEKKEARAAIEKEIRTEILAEELAKKLEIQVGQQELFDYAIQMSQTYGMDINRLFSDPQQISAVVADLGRAKALIEALRTVTVKDTAGADVDLTAFLGGEAEAEEASEEAADADGE